MCTLRNFPHLIDHCIEWSRAKFTDLFVSPAQQLQMFLDDPYDFLEKLRAETLDKVCGDGFVARSLRAGHHNNFPDNISFFSPCMNGVPVGPG